MNDYLSGLDAAELAAAMNKKMQEQQNELDKLPAKILTNMEAVFDRFLGPIPKPAPTQVGVGLGLGNGEEALLDRVEEMVKTTIQSELRNHHRAGTRTTHSAPDDYVDDNKRSATTTAPSLNTPEVRRMHQIQKMIKATIQAELCSNIVPDSVESEKRASATASPLSLNTTPEPEVRQIPKDYLLNQKLSVVSAWQCWHLGEQRGTGTDGGSGTKPYVTMPWKKLKFADLGGQQSILSNLKFLCEKLDAAAAPAIFQKLPSTPPSLADLATAFRSERVQAVLDDISTTPANRKRRIDQLHWGTVARSLWQFHTSSKRQKLPPQPLHQDNKVILTNLTLPNVLAGNKREDSGDNLKV